MPYLNRWWGEVWGQCFWNEFHMLFYFSGFLGYLVMAHYMHTHLTWSRSKRLRTGIALMIIGAVPLYNIYSVLVLTFEAEGEEQDRDTGKLKEACVNILKNPIILSIALGLAVSLLRLDFPVLIDKTINNVASMATPLALITLGAGFEGKKALAKIKPTLVAAFIKLVAQAAVFIPVAIHFGFTGEKLIAIMVMLAAPATPSCYIMAKSMKNDDVLTASIIVVTTLLAAFTLTGWIFILRTMGYI